MYVAVHPELENSWQPLPILPQLLLYTVALPPEYAPQSLPKPPVVSCVNEPRLLHEPACVGVNVGVGVGVDVAVAGGVFVNVGVEVEVLVNVGVEVEVLVNVGVCVRVGVGVGVGHEVLVPDCTS